jgi:hypothetical protein
VSTYRIGAGIQLIHESLVPRVDTVGEDVLDGFEQAMFTSPLAFRQGEGQLLDQFLGSTRRHKNVARAAIRLLGGPLAEGLEWCGLVGGPDKGDNQSFYRIDELTATLQSGPVPVSGCSGSDGREESTYMVDFRRPCQGLDGVGSVSVSDHVEACFG